MNATTRRSAHPDETRGLSIWVRLILVVLAGVVPMALLAGAVAWRLVETARERQGESLVYSSRAIVSALDARFNQYMAVVRELGPSASAPEHDLTEFRERAAMSFPIPEQTWVILSDASGHELFSLRKSDASAAAQRSVEAAQTRERAFQTGRVQISNAFAAPVPGGWLVTIELPLFYKGAPFRCLTVAIRADSFMPILNQPALPEGWLVAVSDRDGRLVARTRSSERFVGQHATPDWRQRIAAAPEGLYYTVTLEGEASVAAHATSSVSGWTIGVASTAAVFYAPLHDLMVGAVGLGLVVTGLSIVLALWAASRISGPVQALERSAAALTAGQVASVHSRLPEVQRVWNAITEAVADRTRREVALRESENRFQRLADGAPVLIWVNGVDRTEFINRYYTEFVGARPDQPQHLVHFMHPDDRAACVARYDEAAARCEPFEAEFRLRRRDGQFRWMKATGLPRIDETGRFAGYVGCTFDITDIKSREQHIELILHELSHRSKNLLAVVHSIARQTARQSKDISDFEDRFAERVRALADAHDLLVRHDWKGARIRDVVAGQVLPFDTARVTIEGPDLTVRPEAVQNLVLALHELATNASKHGALTVPTGKVAVGWAINGEGQEARLRLTWRESGGPLVKAPTRTGFGTIVLNRVAPQALSGTGTLDYAPTGLVWTLEVPSRWILT